MNITMLLKLFFYILEKIIIYILAFCYISIFIFFYMDKQGSCVSDGKVWDDSQKICRDDCLTWNEKDGCVPLVEDDD